MDEKVADLLRACLALKNSSALAEDDLSEEFIKFSQAVDAFMQPVIKDDQVTVTVPVSCDSCGGLSIISCNKERLNRWLNKEGLIQDLLPELDANEREILISGTCGSCFDALYPQEESSNDESDD